MNAADSFRALANVLREPAVLVAVTGELVAANAAASTLLGIHDVSSVSHRLADFVSSRVSTGHDFLRACARTRQPIFASMDLRTATGGTATYRIEGLLYQGGRDVTPPAVLLRLTPQHATQEPSTIDLRELVERFTKSLGDDGVGISVTAIVAELGSDVKDNSDEKVVRVKVPYAPREAVAGTETASRTVLVVDDDDAARELIADSLQSAGFSVLRAPDGATAIEMARAHAGSIDLLVTDVAMPRLTGPRVAQALRADAPQLRVLYVSGYADRIELPADSPLSHSGFLAKPFTRGTLLGRVKALLDI